MHLYQQISVDRSTWTQDYTGSWCHFDCCKSWVGLAGLLLSASCCLLRQGLTKHESCIERKKNMMAILAVMCEQCDLDISGDSSYLYSFLSTAYSQEEFSSSAKFLIGLILYLSTCVLFLLGVSQFFFPSLPLSLCMCLNAEMLIASLSCLFLQCSLVNFMSLRSPFISDALPLAMKLKPLWFLSSMCWLLALIFCFCSLFSLLSRLHWGRRPWGRWSWELLGLRWWWCWWLAPCEPDMPGGRRGPSRQQLSRSALPSLQTLVGGGLSNGTGHRSRYGVHTYSSSHRSVVDQFQISWSFWAVVRHGEEVCWYEQALCSCSDECVFLYKAFNNWHYQRERNTFSKAFSLSRRCH